MNQNNFNDMQSNIDINTFGPHSFGDMFENPEQLNNLFYGPSLSADDKKFCLENDISEKLVKPLLIQIISSMNKFHLLFNQNINNDNFNYLISLSKEYQKVYKSNE